MENKSDVVFRPATTQRASDVIYQQIYQKIVSQELKPGDRLPSERELVEQFHRSRPSIREALRMLQQDGLIKIAVGVNGGAIVQGISMQNAEQPLRQLIEVGTITLQELVDYRSYNDHSCANLAAKYHTEEDIAKLREIIVRYGENVGDSKKLSKIDIEFHKALAESSHNKLCILITDVVTALCTSIFWEKADTAMSPEDVLQVNQLAYENHSDICEAVATRDPEKIKKVMNEATYIFSNAMGPILSKEK